MLGGELAVPCNPKSAYAGPKNLSEKKQKRIKPLAKKGGGSRVTDGYEPRQVREEAAVNNLICITSQSAQRSFYC